MFAGIVALLNEARIQAGKPSMGLVNKFVYDNAAAFTDVTIGSDKVRLCVSIGYPRYIYIYYYYNEHPDAL